MPPAGMIEFEMTAVDSRGVNSSRNKEPQLHLTSTKKAHTLTKQPVQRIETARLLTGNAPRLNTGAFCQSANHLLASGD